MDTGTGDVTTDEGMKPDTNANSNNFLSDQDVNIRLNLTEATDQQGQTAPTVFDDESSSRAVGEDPTQQSKDAERQEWLDNLQKEKMQWEALESMQRSGPGGIKSTPLISFSEVLQYFQTKSLDKTKIKPTIPRSGISALIHFLFGPPRLNSSLEEERDLVFCIAQTQLDDGEEIHKKVLQTIYKKLTGSKFDCLRRGSHWETIGFQGNDPATDLRGVGFLGLMHILHGVTDPNVCSLFSEFYRLSLDEEQNFPFCVMSLNVTRITLQVLREEKLCRNCNRRKQVIAVMNDFYVAVFLHIYTIWKTMYKTMQDSGHVIQDAEKQAKKNPKSMLRNLETTLKERKADKRRKMQPVCPVPISGPIPADQQHANVQRAVSAASSVSVASGPKDSSNRSQGTGTPNSARFVRTKKSSDTSLHEFTDICREANEEPVTEL